MTRVGHQTHPHRLGIGLLVLLLALGGSPLPARAASGAETARGHLAAGIRAFGAAQYASAIAELRQALALGLSYLDDRVDAYKYLDLSYAAQGQPEQARESFRQLVALAPDYRLSPSLPPEVLALYDDALRAATGAPGHKKAWFGALGGGAAVGAIVWLLVRPRTGSIVVTW